MTCPTPSLPVSISGDSPLTVTDSATAPSAKLTEMFGALPTWSTMPVWLKDLKPASITSSR